MSFLKAVEVTNAVFILNSREGLKEHLKGSAVL
jgi:hypothetical protein